MVPTVPTGILVVLALAAALLVALVTWGVLKWSLRGPAERRCAKCGAGISAEGECPRCARKIA